MSKQKFQIGDIVKVKRGNKNEIGRVGKVVHIIRYCNNKLGYIIRYNDDNFPVSSVFYADMLVGIDTLPTVSCTIKDGIISNTVSNTLTRSTTCKYCRTPFNEIPESKNEPGACEYCEDKRAMISDTTMRKSANVDLHEFSNYGQDGDWLEVTEWSNGEGINIVVEYPNKHDRNINVSLSYDELEAIINIVNKFGTLPPIYTKNENGN